MRTYTELARLPCHGHERKPCSAITLNPLLTVLSTRGLGRLRRFRQEVRQPQLLLLREGSSFLRCALLLGHAKRKSHKQLNTTNLQLNATNVRAQATNRVANYAVGTETVAIGPWCAISVNYRKEFNTKPNWRLKL